MLFIAFFLDDETQFFVLPTDSTPNGLDDQRTEIKVNGELGWNELQLVMSRSTTPDLIKMLGKLQDFFNQQQRSGMHAFTGHRPLASSSSLPLSRSNLRYGQKRDTDEKRDDMDSNLKQDGKCEFE